MRLALPAMLLGGALLLGGAILYELSAPLDPETVAVVPAPKRAPRLVARQSFVPPPADIYADIDTRPLFSAERKPLADSTLANGAAGAASDLSLVGVIMDGDRAVALIRNKSTSQSASAIVGGTVDGWRVARIDPTSVTLRSAGGDVVVPLEGPSDRPPGAAIAAAPLPAQAAPTAQSDWTVQTAPNVAASPGVSAPAAAPPAQAPAAPAPAAKPDHKPTIAPEALKGAPRDPKTGEPTL